MSEGMAEVIAAHSVAGMSGGTHIACRCNKRWVLHAEYRTHLADELTKAGYGNVQEAREDAFTDAVAVLRDRGKWARSEHGPYVVKTGYDEDGHGNAAQDVDEWYADWIEHFPYRDRKVEA